MTVATIVALAAAETEHAGNAALETVIFPILALTVFAALALVTASNRHIANRHAHKAEAYARAHAHELEQTGHGH